MTLRETKKSFSPNLEFPLFVTDDGRTHHSEFKNTKLGKYKTNFEPNLRKKERDILFFWCFFDDGKKRPKRNSASYQTQKSALYGAEAITDPVVFQWGFCPQRFTIQFIADCAKVLLAIVL